MRAFPALALLVLACGTPGVERVVTARWETREPIPEARTEVSVTTDRSTITLIGGFGPGEGRRPRAPRSMWAHDPMPDRWIVASEIPEEVNHAGFAATDTVRCAGCGSVRQTSSLRVVGQEGPEGEPRTKPACAERGR